MSPRKQSKKVYNKQPIFLECSVFTRKSQAIRIGRKNTSIMKQKAQLLKKKLNSFIAHFTAFHQCEALNTYSNV